MSIEIKHWAEDLEVGDRCFATIRHKTDGTKNKYNVKVIVTTNFIREKFVNVKFGRKIYCVPYNELSEK